MVKFTFRYINHSVRLSDAFLILVQTALFHSIAGVSSSGMSVEFVLLVICNHFHKMENFNSPE